MRIKWPLSDAVTNSRPSPPSAGEPIDERGPVATDKRAAIHAEAPDFVDMSVSQEILVTGIKVVDLLAPYAKGGKIGTSQLAASAVWMWADGRVTR